MDNKRNLSEPLDRAFPPNNSMLLQEEQCDLMDEVLKELKSVNKTLAIVAQALVRLLEPRVEVTKTPVPIDTTIEAVNYAKSRIKPNATRPKKTT